jgi:ATPase subunit of ABC transporter with duplicated ATPase domains
VKLLLDPPNLLLMDEPTTHLDMSSIDALLYALDQFEGTLVFISHDVYFIRALAQPRRARQRRPASRIIRRLPVLPRQNESCVRESRTDFYRRDELRESQ